MRQWTGRWTGRLARLAALALATGLLSNARSAAPSVLAEGQADWVLLDQVGGTPGDLVQLRERTLLLVHALPNAAIPVVTVAGLSIPHLLANAVVVERIFGWPGIGRLTLEALFRRDYPVILKRVVDRVYLMRCQLVHGAATRDGRLNRRPLRRCTMMMDRLMPAFLLVLIDHGWSEDWGSLCYPPIK